MMLICVSCQSTVVAADVQTAGRGRLGRSWEAQPGTSLLFSVVLTPRAAPERLPGLTLVGAHAVADALPVETAIKYPNDVLVHGHDHKAKIEKVGKTLVINPGEVGGWLYGKSTLAILDTTTMKAEIIPL